MKKLLLLALTAAGAVVFKKKLDEQQAERDLWAEATDSSGPGAGLGDTSQPG